MRLVSLVVIIFVSQTIAGCVSQRNWNRDDFYSNHLTTLNEAKEINWRIINNYSLSSDSFRNDASIEELNSSPDFLDEYDYEIKKLAYESKRFPDTVLTTKNVPDIKTWHYDEGLGRYGEMIALNTYKDLVSSGQIQYSATPEQALERTYYESLLPIKQWHVRLSVVTEQELCQWKLKSSGNIHVASCSGFVMPVTEAGETVSTTINGDEYQATVKPKNRVILALGDSYISGEGNEYWIDTRCHRSNKAWPNLLAARYAAEHPHESITLISRACSGAHIEHIVDEPYEGVQAPPGTAYPLLDLAETTPPQLSEALLDLCLAPLEKGKCLAGIQHPDIVLISIGGNDANFGKVVSKTLFKDVVMIEDQQRRLIETERENLEKALTYIHEAYPKMADHLSATFPNSEIIATNYLNPLHASKTDLCTGEEDGGFFGGLTSFFSKLLRIRATEDEMFALQHDFITPLVGARGIAGLVEEQVKKRPEQWHFVRTAGLDANGNQLEGNVANGICLKGREASGRWFNRVADSDRRTNEVSGTAHPNIFGQLAYTKWVYPTFERILQR